MYHTYMLRTFDPRYQCNHKKEEYCECCKRESFLCLHPDARIPGVTLCFMDIRSELDKCPFDKFAPVIKEKG